MIKLHLGCGAKQLPGYVNIDIMENRAANVIADLRKLPYDDGSVDFVYSCAAIEHFGRREWVDVLREWARVLKPGGVLRLSTADFEAAIARYHDAHDMTELLGLLIGGQKDDYDWHGMIFDFDTLAAGLRDAGFEDVRRYDWRQTELGKLGIDDFSQAYLPHMDKENGRLMMLNVEATRSGPSSRP
jgi:predicted SAM-dependent methyltransferase